MTITRKQKLEQQLIDSVDDFNKSIKDLAKRYQMKISFRIEKNKFKHSIIEDARKIKFKGHPTILDK